MAGKRSAEDHSDALRAIMTYVYWCTRMYREMAEVQ